MNISNRVKLTLLLVITFGLTVGMWFLTTSKTTRPLIETAVTIGTETNTDSVEQAANQDIVIEQENESYTINATYPNEPSGVREFAEEIISEFKSYDTALNFSGEPYVLNLDYDTYVTQEYTSFSLTYYQYTGGANANGFVKTFVYDSKGNIQVNSLVNEYSNTKELVALDLTRQFQDNWFKNSLDEPTIFKNFYYKDNDLVFIFNEYDVAPGVAGIVEVAIPLSELIKQNESTGSTGQVTDFFSCVDVTGIVLESYPRQCVYNEQTYVEQINEVRPSDGDSIELQVSVGPEKVSCTGVAPQTCLVVDGQFFYDSIVGFEHESGYRYELRIKRTLAFGTTDPELIPADAGLYVYELLEVVSKTQEQAERRECVIAGCSSQLCISAEDQASGGGISTCEYKEEYACYRVSECRVQETGECGWTETPELVQCLENPPSLQ